jgi:YD repeat-containing protein
MREAGSVAGVSRVTTQKYNAAGQPTNITVTAGSLQQVTSIEYNLLGQRSKTILPDGGVVTYQYGPKGELLQQTGARTYPVSYTYSDQGRLATLSTYRNGITGSADITSWQYDSQRGWMTAKVYADNSTNSYQYFANGALQKRTWARGVQTEYLYAQDGALTNVNYSDSTPDVFFTQDRLGRNIQIVDGTDARTNSYAEDGSLISETLPQVAGGTLAYTRDALGRLTNMSLLIGGTRSVASEYGFDNAGRLSSVSDGMRTVSAMFLARFSSWEPRTATPLSRSA